MTEITIQGDCDVCGIGTMMPVFWSHTVYHYILRTGYIFPTRCNGCGDRSYISEQYLTERIIDSAKST